MKIVNLYYSHGHISYVEFTSEGTTRMLTLEHFIARYGLEVLDNINAA